MSYVTLNLFLLKNKISSEEEQKLNDIEDNASDRTLSEAKLMPKNFVCNKVQPIWWETMSWLQIKGAFPLSPKQHKVLRRILQCILITGQVIYHKVLCISRGLYSYELYTCKFICIMYP